MAKIGVRIIHCPACGEHITIYMEASAMLGVVGEDKTTAIQRIRPVRLEGVCEHAALYARQEGLAYG